MAKAERKLRNPKSKAHLMLLGGVIFGVLGLFSFLFNIGQPFNWVPIIFYEALLLKIALIIAGFLLLYAAFSKLVYGLQKLFSIIAGIIIAFFGTVPLLLDYGIIPFEINFEISPLILSIVLIIYGVYLIISAQRLYRALRLYQY